jgi:hypothetical protein
MIKSRDEYGQFKSVVVDVKCSVGYPCDATAQISTCINRRRCKKNNELSLMAELGLIL